jgi:hypothetical protein
LPKKTFDVAAKTGADLIIQLKDNQPTLHQQAKDLCASATPLSTTSSRNRGRNRQEERSVAVFDAATAFTDTEWSSLVGAVIRVERDVLTRSAKTGFALIGFRGGDPGWGGNGRGSLASSTRDATQLG